MERRNDNNDVHIMIDLETMGTNPSAAIISIGLVVFKTTDTLDPEFLDELKLLVSLASSVANGGIIDPNTVMGWMQPEQEAARASLLGKRCMFGSIGSALNDVSHLIRHYSAIKPLPLIWGNGAGFDNVILASAYRNAGLTVPWGHRRDRCFRTLKTLKPEYAALEPEFQGVKHSALADAKHQARWLNRILQEI